MELRTQYHEFYQKETLPALIKVGLKEQSVWTSATLGEGFECLRRSPYEIDLARVAEGQALPPGARVPNIPPGAPNWAMTGELRFKEDVTLYALWPHMHYRGKDMTFVLTRPDGKDEILLSVPRYNPNWQFTYELAAPLKISMPRPFGRARVPVGSVPM